MRYQIVVALLVITLMVSCFVAGKEFGAVTGGPEETAAAKLVGGVLRLGAGGTAAAQIDDVSVRPVETFQEVLSHLRRQYVTPIKKEDDFTYGAIRGMLSVLRAAPYEDRYSRLMTPDEYKSFQEENEGHFGGIGAQIGMREIDLPPGLAKELKGLYCPVCGAGLSEPKRLQVVIVAPLPDSPAMRAGLRAGDQVLRVNDTLTAGLGLSEVVDLIKGPAGTSVRLQIARDGQEKPVEVKLTRAVIEVKVEHRMLPGNIGYLQISTFNENTSDMAKEALRDLRSHGMKGLLLDLRDDPGGGLDVCVLTASQFIGTGPVVYIQERGGKPEARNAANGSKPFDLPLVVMTNLGTASAAEILAGAIQDAKLGALVGGKTYGKGLVQTVIPLRDGSALVLTTARYFTPKMRDIDKKGIEPDVKVDQPQQNEFIPIVPLSERDAQAAKALEVLREMMSQRSRAAA
jgi:carboxyl-terminal processing protease